MLNKSFLVSRFVIADNFMGMISSYESILSPSSFLTLPSSGYGFLTTSTLTYSFEFIGHSTFRIDEFCSFCRTTWIFFFFLISTNIFSVSKSFDVNKSRSIEILWPNCSDNAVLPTRWKSWSMGYPNNSFSYSRVDSWNVEYCKI